MEKSEKKIDIVDILVKIILIAIIIFLLMHNCSMLKKIDKNKKQAEVPVGNIDVFEFKCEEKKCKDVLPDQKELPKPDNGNNNNGNSNNNNNNNNNDNDKDDTEEDVDGEFSVYDTVNWNNQSELRIFSNPVFEMEEKIAPESSNVYEFIVRNNTNLVIKYNMKFNEENAKNINMKYRLKRGSEYVAGSANTWLTADELNASNITLDSNKDHVYYLEWKWFSSDNDTSIGTDITSKYKLSIAITAEGTDA